MASLLDTMQQEIKKMNKSVFSFSTSANNVTLLAFAAERRRLLQQSIDDRLPAGPTTANRPKESLYRNTHTHTVI